MQISAAVLRQFLSFGLVGVAGFVVDSGVLYCALAVGVGLYAGRVISYLTAATTTWVLNRRYTFGAIGTGNLFNEWARFVVSQLSGATVNLTTYMLLVYFFPYVAQRPVIGVAFGSIAGLLVNFIAARSYAFKARS